MMIEQIQQQFTGQINRNEADWLQRFRRQAFESLNQTGWPTRQDELWRFIDLSALNDLTFEKGGERNPVDLPETGLNSYRITFVNGRYSPDLSAHNDLPEGVEISNLSQRLPYLENHLGKLAAAQSPFVAANSALFDDGAYIQIADGVKLDKPIQILYLADQHRASIQLRTIVIAGQNAKATVIEHFYGAPGTVYWCNAVTELFLAQEAQLDHIKLQQESKQAFHFHTLESALEKRSKFSSHAITLGGLLARNDIRSKLAGEEAESACNGITLLKEQQECDTHLFMNHAVPNCNSHQLYKGILDERAHAVFCGRILVARQAQKTDAIQSNANLLLSRGAKINSLPQLEIYADDVKCTHGSTVGELDEEALYYLQTRGINRETGHTMMTYAFAQEVLDSIESPDLKACLSAIVQQWLKEVAA
jgi:Fe-S cluster assembly protein SufD